MCEQIFRACENIKKIYIINVDAQVVTIIIFINYSNMIWTSPISINKNMHIFD